MATNWQGLSMYRDWLSTATFNVAAAGAQSITNPSSAIAALLAIEARGQAVVDASFRLSLTTSGWPRFACTSSFALAFDSVGTANALGFASSGYVAATVQTGDRVPDGLLRPHTSWALMLREAAEHAEQGIVGHGIGLRLLTPGLERTVGILEIGLPSTWWDQWAESVELLSSTPKLDAFDEDFTTQTHWYRAIRSRERSAKSRFTTVSIDVVRAS